MVLLHAYPFDSRMWAGVTELLQNKCRVIAPDLRGFGASNDMQVLGVTIDAMADDVVSALDFLGEKQAVIAGCSLGGYVALSMAARYPERCKGLGLICTRVRADNVGERQVRGELAEAVLSKGMEVLFERSLPRTLHGLSEAQIGMIREIADEQFPDAASSTLYALRGRADRTQFAAGCTIPTAVFAGGVDQIVPIDEPRSWAPTMPNAEYVEIPEAGHLLPVSHPVEVAKKLFDLVVR